MRVLGLGNTPISLVRDSESLVSAVAAVTGMRLGAVRNRASRAHGKSHVRTVFADRWPARLDELGAEPGEAVLDDQELLDELTRLIGRPDVAIPEALRKNPTAPVREVLKEAWQGGPSAPEDLLALTVQQVRARGDLPSLAKLIRIDPARLARRVRTSHGAMVLQKAIADLLPEQSPEQGRLFGRYMLEGAEWQGGCGIVREAWDLGVSPRRRVVLKWPRTIGTSKMLKAEYEHARELRHPGLVGYFEMRHDADGSPVLVIEHGGVSLKERLKTGGLTIVDALWLCRKLADALDYLGEQNLAHLDLHLGNILLDGDGQPRITDFGIARHFVGVAGQTQVTSQVHHYYPDFAAPEVRRSGNASRRSDQFSLALVFLCCVCGGEDAAVAAIESGDLPLSSKQAKAIRKARSESPTDRYPNCRSFMDALDRPGFWAMLWG